MRTNVSFWSRGEERGGRGPKIRARIFERGVGETLSSGTGATGAAVAAHLAGVEAPIEVVLDGGSLLVEIDDQMSIHLSGWAVPVYTAEMSGHLLEALSDQVEPPTLGSTS
jgi:diaminopimelate epimerase